MKYQILMVVIFFIQISNCSHNLIATQHFSNLFKNADLSLLSQRANSLNILKISFVFFWLAHRGLKFCKARETDRRVCLGANPFWHSTDLLRSTSNPSLYVSEVADPLSCDFEDGSDLHSISLRFQHLAGWT